MGQVSSVQHGRCNDFLTVTSLVSQKLSHPLRGTQRPDEKTLSTFPSPRVPAGSFAKASSEGAKMVTASIPFKVSTRPRSETILTKVVNEPAPTATSTTSPSAILGAGSAIGITGATAILYPW